MPWAIDELAGLTARDSSVAAVTLKVDVPLTFPETAVIVVDPGIFPRATPVVEMVATAGFEELQLTVVVRFCVLPSLKVPVAAN